MIRPARIRLHGVAVHVVVDALAVADATAAVVVVVVVVVDAVVVGCRSSTGRPKQTNHREKASR